MFGSTDKLIKLFYTFLYSFFFYQKIINFLLQISNSLLQEIASSNFSFYHS